MANILYELLKKKNVCYKQINNIHLLLLFNIEIYMIILG